MLVESISLVAKHAQFDDIWAPKRVAKLDNYDVKLAKGNGSFDWHAHHDADELFLVTRGNLRIEIDGQDPVILGPGELCVIPKGVRHHPVCLTDEVHIMLLEQAGIVNTGDNTDSDLTQTIEDI
ncbi:cupin domain-containing protein [Maricaulis sp.]|uniref:cupin domain-containing protein n=1 Tax=Maricaulis sp. TaxID=1486257 RepID=UPI003A903C45